MTVQSVVPDREARTVTLTVHHSAPIERVWQLWADPRLLERWWGPPSFPASVGEHELTPGGIVTYVMTGPDGQNYPGWWRISSTDAPSGLTFDDGFGEPGNEDMPLTHVVVALTTTANGTRMVVTSSFDSVEDMDQLLEMGMLEGVRQAAEQTDELLLSATQG